ncbi:hypothetical protein BCR41DRAFT_426079 [Lobosporangium transversale]|uniref:PHD-type domain-containing protein n=1 Tax=Lobosporangium transversale TaxID=64571 RepID=A0A1Y2G9K7_9FUNG|nr:hypothetical protein BCR41DRAFT_426079 [Lobosporangium transversale]ORZ04050.1 hypothetical protein BCR41DRAFT_426079 [Lobosporangium transversale]|eukprot:XP_021876327.1 hypothetical protein BCR41DRAFT_426079 [Lobosporangium transversale]
MSSNGSSPHSTPAETDCLVCGSGKSLTKNPILFCDGPDCDIPVHQKCYGIEVVPEGNWYCQRCEDHIPVANTPSCCCPQRTGAFKRTTAPNQYIHVACARAHPSLNDNEDPITFNSSLAQKQICCLCKSDFGICSVCSIDNCLRAMHVTCAQKEDLMTKGKNNSLYCDIHRDIGALNRILKKTQAQQNQVSKSDSAYHRLTKRSKSYRELSTDDENDDEDDGDGDHEAEDDEESSISDNEMLDPTAEYGSEDDRRRSNNSKSNASSSSSSTAGSRSHSKNKRSVDTTERRRRERNSDSEEIDVDDSEAVLGSSTSISGGGSMGQRKKVKSVSKAPKESAAESQRRRLLMTLDKNKRRQNSTGNSINNLTNLSNMPIRTLGGLGVTASNSILGSASGNSEVKQKLPGISRYNSNNSTINDNPSSNLFTSASSPSPSIGSMDRFGGSGYSQSNGRGTNPNDGSARNPKSLTFDLHSGIDASSLKASSSHQGSTSSGSIALNTGSPVHNRLNDKQQQSPKSAPLPLLDDSKDLQTIVRNLQAKLANQEGIIQAMSTQNQQLQQQLAGSNSSGTLALAGSSGSNSNMNSTHVAGAPGQDLQYRFDKLQHVHAEEKMRNLMLRKNLRDLFGFLQVPVVSTGGEGGESTNVLLEWNPEKLDEYVQALRDSVVGTEPIRSTLDVKRRDIVVDRVLKEINNN